MKEQRAYVFKKVVIRDPQSTWHNQKVDIQVEDGCITKIAPNLSGYDPKTEVVFTSASYSEVNVMPGWVDPHVEGGEPGYEARETLHSLSECAVNGGFTTVGLMPSLQPVTRTVEHFRSLQQLSKDAAVRIIPHVSITDEDSGPTAVYEMRDAGAKLFTNGFDTYLEEGPMITSMQYGKAAGIRIGCSTDIPSLRQDGLVYETAFSAGLGLPTIPNIAETYAVKRLLELHNYTNGMLHVLCLTSPAAIDLWQEAMALGSELSFSVGLPYLLHNEECLRDFDSHFKISPPWQDEATQKALCAKVMSKDFKGMITSYHQPRSIEDKEVEFGYAASGMATLDFGITDWLTTVDSVDFDHLVNIVSRNARKLLALDDAVVEEGNIADFTLLASCDDTNGLPRNARSIAYNIHRASSSPSWFVPGVFVNAEYHSNG